MTISQLFSYVDNVKPNAFDSATKLVWLNEIEGKVQSEILLWPQSECFEYTLQYPPYSPQPTVGYAEVWYPNEHTMAFADKELIKGWRPGGLVSVPEYAETSEYDTFINRKITDVTSDGLVFAESFTETGMTHAVAQIAYNGNSATLLVKPPHDNFYQEYIIARIDYANGEYDKYANSMAMFNTFWEETKRWYARTYRPGDYRGFRTIQAILSYVDEVKPNSIADATKLVWMNEIEGRVQTEVFLWNDAECTSYNLDIFERGGIIRDFIGSVGTEITVGFAYTALTIKAVDMEDTSAVRVTVDETLNTPRMSGAGSFEIGGKPEVFKNVGVQFVDDHSFILYDMLDFILNIEPLVKPPHDKIYADYLIAQVDFHDRDYDAYKVTKQKFDESWGEFTRWFARTYCPAGRRR